METVPIPLSAIVALSLTTALLTIMFIISIVILIRWRCHNKQSDEHHKSDEIPLDRFPSPTGFYPGIAVIGKETTIIRFMHARGQGEGRSQSANWGPYQTMYNPHPWARDVHAAVFLHDADLSTMEGWLLNKRPVMIVGADPVREHWWASNWLMCLTDPFEHLLERIYNGNEVPELRL
jgi:hypothetical protein